MLTLPMTIAVVGMGGIGKTTLAQLVYNDDQVRNHFRKKNMWWVCVSDPFDRVRLANAIIEAAGDPKVKCALEWNALHNQLSDAVKDKRFLLVLDDVWTEDFSQWQPFKTSLEHGAQGSQILVTSRNEGVAAMMNATHIHHVGELPEKDGWSLFSRIAFAGRIKDQRPMLRKIGKQIVKNCNGVPLSIKTVAGFLRHKKRQEDWERVSKSNIWNESEVENKILPALLLSYYALPPNLKRCFAYCAVFPKDIKLEKNELIKLWTANGFLTSKGEKELERIGEEYFDDSIMRSFFQDVRTNIFESFITCKMHDLIHDLAQYVTTNEIFVVETSGQIHDQFDSSRVRHLTLLQTVDKNSTLSTTNCNARKLHTLKIKIRTHDIFGIFHCLSFLRVLDLRIDYLTELPRDVEKLKHLRYFKLVSTYVTKLLETLCNLHNLKTLMIDCLSLRELPERLGEMANLRHLQIAGDWKERPLYWVFLIAHCAEPWCLSLEFKQLRQAGASCTVSNMSAGGCELGRRGLGMLKNLICTDGTVGRISFLKLKELQINHFRFWNGNGR